MVIIVNNVVAFLCILNNFLLYYLDYFSSSLYNFINLGYQYFVFLSTELSMNNKLFRLTKPLSNTSSVFRSIYNSNISRQEISESLNLSLPTIRQAVNELSEKGIVFENGYYESTGGRKPSVLAIIPTAKVALGVDLIKDSLRISAIDLCGNIIKETKYNLQFLFSDDYFKAFGSYIKKFISELGDSANNLTSVFIAVQGIVSQDGETLLSGKPLSNTGMTTKMFEKYIDYPCRFVNDTEAAAFAELWCRPDMLNAAYISLNRVLGGAIIINGRVFQGDTFKSAQNGGIIGHMRLIPGGKRCYCGKNGCFQAYCSITSLEYSSGLCIEDFIDKVHDNDAVCCNIFDEYLSFLALGINNIRMIIDSQFIIGGYLDKLLCDSDLKLLATKVEQEASFENMDFHYLRSINGPSASSRGAAYIQLNDFIESI